MAQGCGQDLLPRADKPRQVFAVLALNANRVVPVQTLMDELWGERPPRTAATTLQTYILQLRRGLTPVLDEQTRAKDVLATRYNGYLLAVSPGARDVDRFDRLCEQGRTASARGDEAAAYRAFTEALGLWRGPALVDLPHGPALEPEAVSLAEARNNAFDARVTAGLRLGLHNDLLAELTLETARHPMDQNMHAHLILAQYRAGRISDALDTYARLRVTMADELGLEPSPRLRELRQAVITTAPELEHIDATA